MGMNIKTGVFISGLVGAAIISAIAFSFIGCGPSNYDDCILQNMRGAHTKLGEAQITLACEDKFSVDKSRKRKKLSAAELAKLTGRAALDYGDHYSGTIYNGNSNLKITKVSIQLTTSMQSQSMQRVYSDDNLSIAPLQTGTFGFSIITGDKGAEYGWQIVSAEGLTT